MPTTLFEVLIVIVIGIGNAGYLYWQYREHELRGRKMICLLGGKCEQVVISKYGKTFGIKNELIGLSYYFLILPLVLISFIYPAVSFLILGIAGLATLYSSYLIITQTFLLRAYCSWCIFSALINYTILILVINIFFR